MPTSRASKCVSQVAVSPTPEYRCWGPRTTCGHTITTNSHSTTRIFEDNATKIQGKHELQFGVHYPTYMLNTLPQQVFTTGVADFGVGPPRSTTPPVSLSTPLALPHGRQYGEYRTSGIAGYYQTPLRKGTFKLRRGKTPCTSRTTSR